MFSAALRDRTPWLVALFVLLAVFASPCLSLGDISSQADLTRAIDADPVYGIGSNTYWGIVDEATIPAIPYGGNGSSGNAIPLDGNNNGASNGFSFVAAPGGNLAVTGDVSQNPVSQPFAQLDSYSGTLLEGTVDANTPPELQSGGALDGGITWYLVDVDGGAMQNVFGSQALVEVTYEPGDWPSYKVDIYGEVPEPSALLVWSLLGPAGVAVGAFACRRRRLSRQP
jgi:hypothetical protein